VIGLHRRRGDAKKGRSKSEGAGGKAGRRPSHSILEGWRKKKEKKKRRRGGVRRRQRRKGGRKLHGAKRVGARKTRTSLGEADFP